MSVLPLSGRRIVVTRTRDRAQGLVDKLHELGASVEVVPLITTVPVATPDEIRAAAESLRHAPGARWAVFTSVTAVRLVANVLDAGALDGVSIAAVGPGTDRALREAQLSVHLVPDRADAKALARALVDRGAQGTTVWLPNAEAASPLLADRLSSAGAEVRVQHLYRSDMPLDAARRLRSALDKGADAITLTSGSTARHLVEALGALQLPAGVHVVCIGGQTAKAATELGLRIGAIAQAPSADGLVSVLTSLFAAVP